MSGHNGTSASTTSDLAALQAEVARLQAQNTALSIQHDLLATWVVTVRMATGNLMLKALSQQILEVVQKLVQAEQGSLFLLNGDGSIAESLLARGSTIREQRREIVGQILSEGLAAWTIEHRQVAVIPETLDDERWITLPNQPYTVRSALCAPLVRGKRLLGIVTLMHSEPQKFNQHSARLMEMAADAIALVVDNAQLFGEQPQDTDPQDSPPDGLPSGIGLPSSIGEARSIERCGLYITTAEGKLRYVNRRFANIFGYRRRELRDLDSILDLIPVDYQDYLARQLERCIQDLERPISCVIPGRHQDGHLMDLEIYAERIHFSGEPGTIGLIKSLGDRGAASGLWSSSTIADQGDNPFSLSLNDD